MSDQIVAPVTRDLSAFGADLTAWLAARLEGARDLALTDIDYPRGAGQSHETILFDAAWMQGGERRRQGFVARIKPTRHFVFPDDLFDQQYRLMGVLHDQGRVRVARTFWLEEDAGLLGAPFFVMERKRGRVPVSIPPYRDVGWVAEATPAERAVMWEDGVRQLAAIQSTPLDTVTFLRGATPGAEQGLAQELDKYHRFIAWAARPEHRGVMEAAIARLERELPKNQPDGLVWGDARLGNMMFGEDFRVVAVMDWEQPSLGGALHDLAWFLVICQANHSASPTRPYLHGMGAREETIALWEEVTGKSAADIEWYEEFTHLKMACCSFRTALTGRYPLASPQEMARRLKVAEAA